MNSTNLTYANISSINDPLEENPIIIGIQIFIFVFLVITSIALTWICFNNSRIRAAYAANLPNHLPYLKYPAEILDEQNNKDELLTTQDSIEIKHRTKYHDDPERTKNYLPASLTPHGTKSSISPDEKINKISDDIFSKMLEDEIKSLEEKEKEKAEKESLAKETTQSRVSQFFSIFNPIQSEGEKRLSEQKEKSKQKKKEEEDKRKQREIEKKEAESKELNRTESTSNTIKPLFNMPSFGTKKS